MIYILYDVLIPNKLLCQLYGHKIMNTSFLNSITSEYIKSITNNAVFARGLSYFKSGRVHNTKCVHGELTAKVSGSGMSPYDVVITVSKKEILHTYCSCFYATDGEICKHIVATLLQWTDQKSRMKNSQSPSYMRKMFSDNEDVDIYDFINNAIPFSFREENPADVLNEIFSEFDNFFVRVNLLNGGPQLELCLITCEGDESTFRISAKRSPHVFKTLKKTHRSNIEFSEIARRIRLYKTPLIPHLYAGINTDGHIELSPLLKTKNPKKENIVFPWNQIEQNRLGEDWIWLNNSYRPIDKIPKLFRPYFYNEKPLIYKEHDAVDFLKEDFNKLLNEPSFIPSEQLQLIEFYDEPDISFLQVQACNNEWLWLDPTYTVGKHTITLSEILACFNKKERYIRKGTCYIKISEDIMDIWKYSNGTIENGRVKISKLGFLRTRAECGKNVNIATCSETQKFLFDFDRITPPQPAPPVDLYKGDLRAYQKLGYDWLWFLYKNNFNGILADEMGLGKTHQAMTLILAALQTEPNLPTLVICPTSVLDHWESKFQIYAPTVRIARFHGKERTTLLTENMPSVVLTTYSILSRDIEYLSKIQWNYVVLDEAQKIKNHKTQMCKAVKLLKTQRRLALTGTPIENRLVELWSIFDFLMPGYLGTVQDFKVKYETPITKYQDNDKREILKKVIHPFKLRRLKKDVLSELPSKIEEKRYCTLLPVQIIMYKDLIKEQGSKLIQKLKDENKPVEYLHIFALLTKLKRLCDHPKLLLNGTTPKWSTSGKFELFKEIMEETLEAGEKVVVFSQYLEMLDIIGNWLSDISVTYESLRGSTKNRGKVIERFQNNPDCNVFLGSLLAGGLGIDLTAASVVIHYDRWWNAAREDQATDRVHRIGQTRGVQVFKLITRGTLEEKIDAMITKKAALMNSIVESDDVVFKAFSREDLIELLSF